jgi:hypothetical protein
MNHANPSARLRRWAPTGPQPFLASPGAGADADETGARAKIPRMRIEDMLRDELRRRWVAPAEEYARFQIAQLDAMILKLIDRIEEGDLEAIDCALTLVDRLDRHPRRAKGQRATERRTEGDRGRFLQMLNGLAGRLQPETPEE